MDEQTMAQYQARLNDLLKELRTALDETVDASAPVQLDGSMGRVSRGEAMLSQQMALEMKRRREQHMLRVQTALQRIEKGTYGLCGRCRKPIDPARLDALPDVVLCVRCAA